MMDKQRLHFFILISIVTISGLSQGLLLPLISVIFEKSGIDSSLNGLHATAMYIGVLIVSPFLEKPLRKYGFKRIIMFGGAIVVLSLALFPVWHSVSFWFILRLLIGIGDHVLHFGSQTWITSSSPIHQRGRNISLYGLSFGVGFALGPLLVPLVHLNEALPFFISSLLSLFGWFTLFLLKNEYPENEEAEKEKATSVRFFETWKYAWPALLLTFTYGFLEASLHSTFPIYALRNELNIRAVSIILPAFAIGGIVFQLPLGVLSDRFPRKKIILFSLIIGAVSFLLAQMLSPSVLGIIGSFFIAGMFVGSLFSLGMAYMADLVPKHLLPAGNILCGILYSIGSICGPFLVGVILQYNSGFFFLVISLFLLSISLAIAQPNLTKTKKIFFRKKRKNIDAF
ncbi:MFS transporter [Thermolongibacillus altinsuensis]|uniref:MFS transporter n=1 Tax=Thermolongibacillus altinsuensis TaxID=575256 RepID=UPI002553DB85|nr:MFS transporter [Thermolongibacillus altinsuensis]